jgi:hypothetical protein
MHFTGFVNLLILLDNKVAGKWQIITGSNAELLALSGKSSYEDITMNDICAALPINSQSFFRVSSDVAYASGVLPSNAGLLSITKIAPRCHIEFTHSANVEKWISEYYVSSEYPSNGFRGWSEVAVKIPPKAYAFPFSDEFTQWNSNMCRYWKNGFGEVGLTLSFALKDRETFFPGGAMVVGNLPAGFRPANQVNTLASVRVENASAKGVAVGQITASGNVVIGINAPLADQCNIAELDCVFIAGN